MSQRSRYYNSYSTNNNPSSQTDIDNLLYAILSQSSSKPPLENVGTVHRPLQTNTISELETRQAFSTQLDRLLQNVRLVLRRNSGAVITLKSVFSMIFTYTQYIGKIVQNQFNNWISLN